MCGIVGISVSQPNRLPSLKRAIDCIAHRGPDGNGAYQSSHVALGHTRLAILDLSVAGAQPMVSHDGNHVLTYNGEIYNYSTLRDALLAKGVQFRGHSDSEVLLEGYVHFGADVLGWLNGIFAFAVLDVRSQQLFVARDHLGIKPLYWAQGDFGFAFASEIKALIAVAPISRELDRTAIEQHLTYIWSPGERTVFRQVKKLDPGHAMIVNKGLVERNWSYWVPPRYAPRRDWSQAECADQLAQTVDRSVARQLLADVPVGAFLSGGIDSTAIVAAARKIQPDIRCYTMKITGGMQGEAVDDLQYARLAARAMDVSLSEIDVSPDDIIGNIKAMVYALDEPLADPACLNLRFMAEAARKDGIKVLLSGTGGDDLLSGYRRHLASKYNPAWDLIPPPLRRLASSRLSRTRQSNALIRQAAKVMRDIGRNRNDRIAALFAWCTPEMAREMMLAPESDPAHLFGELEKLLDSLGDIPDMEKCLALDRRFFLADHNLTYTDKMGMAVGTEIRVPLLDLEMVEFAATIPAEWKCHGSRAKWLFAQSQIGRVPEEILNRPKSGFGVPLRAWLNGPLRPMVQELLSAETLRRRGIFNPEVMARLINANADGRVDASYSLLSAMCVELWCQKFVDG